MRSYVKMILFVFCLSLLLPSQQVQAQIPVLEVIKAGVKKVIKALDLKVQRLQNKTIWLQNAQKTLENTLSKFKLEEIAEWTERQKEQYKEYYEGLKKVKDIISYYQRIKDVTGKQLRLVNEYGHAWEVIRQDGHFNSNEIEYMGVVYSGILEESLKNIDQISLIIRSFSTSMSDAKRLELINDAADQVDSNYDDLTLFNQQNMLLSIQRSKTQAEANQVKRLYGF